jgi:hypothetical protein
VGRAPRDRVPRAVRRPGVRITSGRHARRETPSPMTGWPSRAPRLLAIALVAGACASTVGDRPGDADLVRLTFLQINDHYVLEPVDGGRPGGMARLATLGREVRRENPSTVFWSAVATDSPRSSAGARSWGEEAGPPLRSSCWTRSWREARSLRPRTGGSPAPGASALSTYPQQSPRRKSPGMARRDSRRPL